MIMCIHYSVTIKNDSEIPIITRMKERLKSNTHPQNRTLSRLFQKKWTRNISRLKGNKAQLVLDILLDHEVTPSLGMNTNDFIISLIAEHIEYARLNNDSNTSEATRVSIPTDTAQEIENPQTYTQLSEQYYGWMERIFAWVDLEKMTRILDDTMQDDTPHPKNHQT